MTVYGMLTIHWSYTDCTQDWRGWTVNPTAQAAPPQLRLQQLFARRGASQCMRIRGFHVLGLPLPEAVCARIDLDPLLSPNPLLEKKR